MVKAAAPKDVEAEKAEFDITQLRLDAVKAKRTRERRVPFDITKLSLAGIPATGCPEASGVGGRGSLAYRLAVKEMRRLMR